MKTSHKRIALLTGASFTALGVATPAFAAPHDVAGPGTYAGTNTSATTITLCTIATNATCMFGVVDTGATFATATVSNTANGQIQHSVTTGSALLVMNNPAGNSAEVGAVAIASNPGGYADASANLNGTAIYQGARATTGSAIAVINNSGDLLIDAYASAFGSSASADAFLDNGIVQSATVTAGATGSAVAALNNSGNLTIEAVAVAVATSNFAIASATMNTGIYQSAQNTGSGDALALINNTGLGSININATAVALGVTGADAYASIDDYGIYQYATADSGDATALISNTAPTAEINIGAHALASAASGYADASATISTGIYQYASASSGNASVGILNGGSIAIQAQATAIGTGASAYASLDDYGIYQSVSATSGNASALIVNGTGASIDIGVGALAIAASTAASASASINDTGIYQSAEVTGTGDAYAGIVNAGNLAIHATADAFGATYAEADAQIDKGIYQFAQASISGDGIAEIVNSGTAVLSIVANAFASATSGDAFASASVTNGIEQSGTGYGTGNIGMAALYNGTDAQINIAANATAVATDFASAYAYIETGISQQADGNSGASAVASIDNRGSLNIGVRAVASGYSASAAASITEDAIYQSASASGGGDASVDLANGGSLVIGADATAVGQGTTSALAADAFAGITDTGISQYAFAGTGGNASIHLGNGSAFLTPTTGGGSTTVVNDAAVLDIHAIANASATRGSAQASATIESAIYQYASATSGGNASVSIENFGVMSIFASANAAGSAGEADATIDSGIYQSANAQTSGDASVVLDNEGVLLIAAAAHAAATRNSALASATVNEAIYGSANADSGVASVLLLNNGELTINAEASAVAETFAFAGAHVYGGIDLNAHAVTGAALVGLVNAPPLDIGATAFASGNSALASATVSSAVSMSATVGIGLAAATLSNNDPFAIHATATAVGTVNSALASANVFGGIEQFASANVSGDALVNLYNGGTMSIEANADASAVTNVAAFARVTNAIAQTAIAVSGATTGGVAEVGLTNEGSINVHANAHAVQASATTAVAVASVSTAIQQFASGSAASLASLDNKGVIDVGANAAATGVVAVAFAGGAGAAQTGTDVSFINGGTFVTGTGTTATTTLNTSAVFTVNATAVASGSFGGAGASAAGLFQNAQAASFWNSGTFGVHANALVSASSGSAGAFAFGAGASASGTLAVSYLNEGLIDVTALASAPSSAYAGAIGLGFSATDAVTTLAVPTLPALITGTVSNAGTLNVAAVALGDGGSHTIGGTTTVPNSSATATGIYMASGANNATIVNSGAINVDAWTNGGPATATGILVEDNGEGIAPAGTEVLTIINDGGSIVVRESVDGGTTFRRGMAIDVANAPNNTVINLLGDGNIYGNIDIQTGDAIAVESGTTYFDGIINPECGPPAYDGLPSLCGQGSLTIDNGGNLVLADPRVTGDPATYDGPAYVYVNEFTVGADGTITYELQPSAGGVQPIGTYPQVFAETANLDGTLVADVTTPTGLFADSYFWNNVIDAEVRNGTFDQCVLDGAYSGSLLIDFGCTYDAGNNVDLFLNRIAFDQVTGLNQNGTSVGSGLECVYDTSLTGGAANLFGDLFLITDPADYNDALNQLAGASYANYLQSFQSLGVHYNDMLDKATSCEIPALAGSVIECRASAPLHMWGQVDYQWRKADGDNEAGTMKAKRLTGMIGLDASVGSAGILGLAVGYGKNNTRDNRYGDVIKGEGWNVGAYGVFDPGTFYVKAMTNWSKFNGDSTRGVDFGIYGPALSFGGVATGSPDVNMWTLGLHGGGRVAMGANSVLTPYLNLDYVSAKLKGFTETGLDGGNLTVLSSKSKHTWLTGGVKYATQMGGVVPEVNLGYRYRMGDERSSFNAAFLGDTGCDFEVVSAAQKRGTFLVGASVGGKMGPVDLRIGYEGEFNSDITSHAGNFRIIVPLGARAAPAPAPAPVMAPPPPPPAPVEEAAPPPPPPPPAPVERGERGQ